VTHLTHEHDNALTATWQGIKNTFVRGPAFGELDDSMRFEAGTALVTGASSGLGFAMAVELARRGMHVIGAARTATPELTRRLREAAGNSASIEMLQVDLGDLDSIDALVETLAERHTELDLVVCNAAIVPTHDARTAQGLEQMFVVNYLANHVLIRGLLARQCIGRRVPDSQPKPRIVFIASEAHRGAKPIALDRLGEYESFTIGEVLERYGTYKLALLTLAFELSRRLEPQGIAVHATCPGAVDSNLAREAPRWSKPLLRVAFRLFFRAPDKAAEPSLHLCLAPHLEGRTGIYLHQWVGKDPDARALDPELGRAQWEATEALLTRLAR
jgi:NAD(P)-dependent dehydrogenase (short-subunit alcohol dehydrogenase family)